MKKKVLIYGIGNKARQLLNNGINADILGFIQTKRSADFFKNKPIYEPQEIPLEYDYILVANTFSDEVYDICVELGIDLDKVVFLYKGNKTVFNDSEKIKEVLNGSANYTNYMASYNILKGSFFECDKELYTKMNNRPQFEISDEYLWPILCDKYAEAGIIHNYFWQDLWAAKKIIRSGVKEHFDIGSRLDGFIAHLLAAEINVTMIDVREFPGEILGLRTIVDDATTLHQIEDGSIHSMSALCSLEHFGLGRYGDPIDPEACFKCFDNIQNKLSKCGKLYIAVPIGRERIEFNAHRIFYATTIINCFNKLQLLECSAAYEGHIEENIDIHRFDECIFNGEYCYGLFEFEK